MNIQKAVKKAMQIDGFITREPLRGCVQIKPGKYLPDCCVCYAKGQAPRPRWQPMAEDLMADDWQVTTEELI